MQGSGFRFWGLGFRGSDFVVQGSGSKVQGAWLWALISGSRVEGGLCSRVQGSWLRAQGSGLEGNQVSKGDMSEF